MKERDSSGINYYTLTHPQKRIWYLENIYPGTSMFNIGGPIRIKGPVDFSILRNAVNLFVERNEGLRLRITERSGTVKQYVNRYKAIEPVFYDFSVYENPEEEFDKWVEEQAQKPFALLDSDLFEFSFFRISDNDNGYLPKFHHIIADGWSIQLLTSQVSQYYTDYSNGRRIDDVRADSYIEYIGREKEYLNSERFNKNKVFWNEKFETLPEGFECTASTDVTGRRKTFYLDKDLSDAVREFAGERKISLNTFFVFLYLLYVYKTTGRKDIILGTPVLNRSGHKEKSMFGMFTSAMPCRFVLNEKNTIPEAIALVNEELIKYYFNQKYPYELLAQDLELKKRNVDSLYNVCINYYNTRLNNELDGMTVENTEFYNGNQVYSLQLVIKDWSGSGEITLDIDYKTHDYREEQITAMYEHMSALINKIVKKQPCVLSELSLVSDDRKNELIYGFNATKADYSHTKTVIQLFEEQASKTADRTAVRHKDRSVTYKELNEKADGLAGFLIKKGVANEDIIGIYMRHSIETVVSILAVLKSGAAYVPIEPDYPVDRINYMLKEAGARILLTNFETDIEFDFDGEVVNVNNGELFNVCEEGFVTITGKPEDLAYVIFTSGSTGKPKGVMIENRSLVNYIEWARKMYVKDEYEVFPFYSSLAFDLTVTSIFTPLISGGMIEVYSKENDEEEYVLYRIMREKKATVVKLTPSHLSLLKDMDNSRSPVKSFIVGGENLKTELARNIFECFGKGVEIYNEYGPTEATVGCMIHKYDPFNDIYDSVPIGIPADNTQIYVLDSNQNPVPSGVHGEIYISGDGLARGYLNGSRLTDERFVDNPFIPGRKMYKTGDLAQFTNDNKIIYIKRVDEQVKIRGNRIELGEIEKHLLEYKAVGKTVVIDREHEKSGSKYLCSYIIRKNGFDHVDLEDLKQHLRKSLPEYMIPEVFVEMDEIPLTINGKVDKKLLPEPSVEKDSCKTQTAFRNDSEKVLVEVLREVLNTNEISINDNFYHIGGDSINAIKVSSVLGERGYTIKARDIIVNPVIKDMAAYVAERKKNSINQEICEGSIKHTPITSWFFSRGFENPHHYNQSVMLNFKSNIDVKDLELVMNELIRHHDALRINFNKDTNELFYNNTHLDTYHKVDVYDLSDLPAGYQIQRVRELSLEQKSSFNMERSLLIKACLFHMGESSQKVLITAHHLIVDGISWRIILADIYNMLKQLNNSKTVKVLSKTDSYRKWAEKINEYGKNMYVSKGQYWTDLMDKMNGYSVEEEKAVSGGKRGILSVNLGNLDTVRLLYEANKTYNTKTEELLIIALVKTLGEIMQKEEFVIELESHGREEVFEELDISGTVGWFTAIYPVELKIEKDNTGEQIKELKEQIRKVPLNGFDFGILKYINKCEAFRKYTGGGIRFNYLGSFKEGLENELFDVEINISEDEVAKCNIQDTVLDINSYVSDNDLHISFGYIGDGLGGITFNEILCRYKGNIKNIIEHCCGKDSIEFTPSDFDAADISQEELDSLFR